MKKKQAFTIKVKDAKTLVQMLSSKKSRDEIVKGIIERIMKKAKRVPPKMR